MALHKFLFAVDSIHSLACFWVYEDGLWHRHTKSKINSFVFQDLQYQRDNGFSAMITRSIRRHISKDLHKNEKDAFSSKSLCIASITEMAARRGVKLFEIHALSGHSLFTNQERNLDQNSLHRPFQVLMP